MLGESLTAALGKPPSGMNTLKAFITRFMATKSFHPWFPVLFRQGWNWVSLSFLSSGVFIVDNLS